MVMFQVRFHGRGGQGVVTAAELLSVAAFIDGHEAQAFPSFGSERMGAPVMAFCRIDDRPIRLREPVTAPDVIVVQDATLLHADPALFAGLAPSGFVLLNSACGANRGPWDVTVSQLPEGHVRVLDASEIALRHLGRSTPNAALLGALSALTGVVRLESVNAAVRQRFPGRSGDANATAATEAFGVILRSGFVAPSVG
jgi:pyruvate ferredoxin oxidoreductase gamma subunit